MLTDISVFWGSLIASTSQHVIEPVLAALSAGHLFGNPADLSEAFLITLIQISIIALVFRPLESLAPAEEWIDRKLTRVDQLYTFIMLLGLFPLFSYLVLLPLSTWVSGSGEAGHSAPSTTLKTLFPVLEQHPLVLLAIYYVIYDFVYYWMHRAQHSIPWWWALHSMHHSQRQMSCWTNDRGSYLDGIIQSFILASVGIAIGVDPSEHAWLTLVSELVQNYSHANVCIGFGRVLERLIVDPKFHRLHHMKVDPARPTLHNCNFGQVLPIWDILFGTALYGEPPHPTGVTDPAVDADNERGLIMMQWYTLRRFWGAVRRGAGWRLGDVGFGPDFEPIPDNPPPPRARMTRRAEPAE